ncbi:hypothetical protein DVS28_b0415 (plasmid) [Euzebya pacifica]|uniref:Uncharacterized protein n=1 Tax=Euzebya pacifica TaxID=1608957 RepID=A0A346Y6R9_9ACTN|nr:hypothetical protein [Euzebya pacifica]AXV10166.1 hypothetical protein DVS28_b0415 [Euzebya pacifica]
MTRYRIVWTDPATNTMKATRPIGLSLAYEVLAVLLRDGRRAWALRLGADGRWTRIGAHTPARSRQVTIGPDVLD